MSDPEKRGEQINNRWWESYLVRYFLGFIIGALCVVVLAWKFGLVAEWQKVTALVNEPGKEPPKPDWSYIAFSSALLGLGYCYLASTPITVLHAGRYGRGGIDSLSRFFWFGWGITLVISMCSLGRFSSFSWEPAVSGIVFTICMAASLGFYKSRDDQEVFPRAKPDETDERYHPKRIVGSVAPHPSPAYQVTQSLVFAFGIWSFVSMLCGMWEVRASAQTFQLLLFGMPVIWIGFVQYAVLVRLLTEESRLNLFYAFLFHARRQDGSRDVRDTYSHLREHSNSIFVVLIELCWLALVLGLSSLDNLPVATGPGSINGAVPYMFFGIGVWVLPTVFMWSRANAMERFFSENPEVFLGRPFVPLRSNGPQQSDSILRTDPQKPEDELLP